MKTIYSLAKIAFGAAIGIGLLTFGCLAVLAPIVLPDLYSVSVGPMLTIAFMILSMFVVLISLPPGTFSDRNIC